MYGGVSKRTFIAVTTQTYLAGKRISPFTLQQALVYLQADLVKAGISTAYGDQVYRESVMQTCLYQAFLRCFPITELPPSLQTVLLPWVKSESRGTEVFVVDDDTTPVSMPVHKLEVR